jgi:hypothetical protein
MRIGTEVVPGRPPVEPPVGTPGVDEEWVVVEDPFGGVRAGGAAEWLLPLVPPETAAITATTAAHAAIRPRSCERRRRVARRRASRRARSASGSIRVAAEAVVAQTLHLGAEDNR